MRDPQVPIVHGVLPNGKSRPVIVLEVINPEDPSPTVVGSMFTLGAADGCSEIVVPFQGRYNPYEGEPGKFVPGTFHSPVETEPLLAGNNILKVEPLVVERIPEVGDKVLVEGNPGVITKVEDGVATLITMETGEEVTDREFFYVNEEKARQDALYQDSKDK